MIVLLLYITAVWFINKLFAWKMCLWSISAQTLDLNIVEAYIFLQVRMQKFQKEASARSMRTSGFTTGQPFLFSDIWLSVKGAFILCVQIYLCVIAYVLLCTGSFSPITLPDCHTVLHLLDQSTRKHNTWAELVKASQRVLWGLARIHPPQNSSVCYFL